MALYTDSDVLTPDMLTALDSEVPDVAVACDLDVTGICRQAWDECADMLYERMDSFGGYVNLLAGAGVQSATLLTNYGMGVSRSRVFLTQIMVSTTYAGRVSPLVRWMIYHASLLFNRAASNRLGKDRYQEKVDRLELDLKRHGRALFVKGLPVVMQPLPCPGALHEFYAGPWGQTSVSAVAGGSAAAGNYDVAITWVDSSKYVSPANKGNAESGPSAVVSVTVPSSNLIHIDISQLVPPTSLAYGVKTFADGVLASLNATGWNIWAAPSGQHLRLQNASPLPIATVSYTFAGAPTTSGALMDPGQLPDANYSFENLLQRA